MLVNNAGFGEYGHFTELDWQRQRDLLQVNIVALVYCGFFTKLPTIGSRLLPRSVTRRCAEKING